MRIVHLISINANSSDREYLTRFGIHVEEGFTSFEVDENHRHWSDISEWVKQRRASDSVRTEFDKKELTDADWLVLVPDWHHGYPQPDENNFGYQRVTYDRTLFCEQCGVGLRQVRPFQMKREPKWGRNNILQMNWVFDEYFVTPEIWEKVFKPKGILMRSVTDLKGVELKTVVQLVVTACVGVTTKGLIIEVCERCNRIKYLPVTRGALPPIENLPSVEMVRSREYFGSGASAYNYVLVSRTLARCLIDAKIRGVSLKPVQRVSD